MSEIPLSEIVNIAGYQFVSLDRLGERRQSLLRECRERGIKGTILLSSEGINLFLAAARQEIDGFLKFIRSDPCFADFKVKESPGDDQPFNRLLVRIKKEIIAFGVDGIEPQTRTSPKLKPEQLKRWLDEGKPFTLLDVRNNYEVELGTFENAVVADIDHFRQFPEAVDQMNELEKDQPIVMFCTGGIRCEKAGPFMERAGFNSIFQLDGGILQYFEDCGDQHYNGDCFVFDQRVAVDPNLEETDAEVCFACQAVLQPADLASPKYSAGVSCPVCYKTFEEKQQEIIKHRHRQLSSVASPLPGSTPYDNIRPMNVPGRFEGSTLLRFLTTWHPHVDEAVWQKKVNDGHFLFDGVVLSGDDKVRGGQRIEHLLPATVEPPVNPEMEVLFEDDWLVVINKPAPLPMHPSGRYNRNTLTWIMGQVYDKQLRAAHRLDANTGGIVVFSKTRKVAAVVQPQFEKQQVEKTYLAMVSGTPPTDEFQVDQPITDEPTIAGGRRVESTGKRSLTEFVVVRRWTDVDGSPRALVEARPKTGRTNQIRIHLWNAGFPIVGDPTYLARRQMSAMQTLSIDDPPMCLFAWKLELRHPATGEPIEFVAPQPAWAIS